MARRSKILSVFAASMLLLVACGDRNATSESTDTTKPTNENTTEASEVSSGEEAVTTKNSENDTKETQTSTSNEEDADASKKSNEVDPILKDFLQNQLKTAKNGMTEGVPFESGETILEDIIKEWGQPTTEYSNSTDYIEYAKNGKVNYAFAVGRGDRIYDLRTFVSPDKSFQLSDIRFDDIKLVAGKPDFITTSGADTVLNYKVGKNTLKFVGPSKSKKLHHISIFNQAASEPMGGEG